jgi:hypothetical protein
VTNVVGFFLDVLFKAPVLSRIFIDFRFYAPSFVCIFFFFVIAISMVMGYTGCDSTVMGQ